MATTADDQPTGPANRVASLDQFRGYTVVGMLLVNFTGGFVAAPELFRHRNNYCSYADTIMPQFFFAVGFALRLTYLRRREKLGPGPAAIAVLRRCAGLALLGVVLYHLDGGVKSWAELQALGLAGFFLKAFQREPFQTLVHIALATVWVLPVAASRPSVRAWYFAGSAALHLFLSWWFYFDWAWTRPVIDGGPLGFLSWSLPLLAGTLAYDLVTRHGASAVPRLLAVGVALMAAGYALACAGGTVPPPPFVRPEGPVTMWTMSQRTGSVSYQVFASGFSLAVYGLFVAACDRPGGVQLGLFRTFGRNALAAYVLHSIVAGAVKPYAPRDVPGWYAAAAFGVFLGINYLFVRGMEKDGVFLRL